MNIGWFLRDNSAVILLVGAAVGWYAASHVSAEALAGARLRIRRRTLGQWMPILIMALIATLLHQPEMALGVLFGTAVAALSLVLGIVTCTHDFSIPSSAAGGFPVLLTSNPSAAAAHTVVSSTEPARRLWAFVLPAALIALMAGFSGRLTLVHALILLIEGFAILMVWRAQPEDNLALITHDHIAGTARRTVELLLACALAVVASLAAARGAAQFSRSLGLISGGFVASMIISPGLVLPMIGSGMNLARSGLYHASVTSSVGVVLLNLCLGLPLVIAVWHVRPAWNDRLATILVMKNDASVPTTSPATAAARRPADNSTELRYPLPLWRVDTVILIVLGLILLPLSIGRWMPGRFEGILMILGYIIYMGLATMAARG